MAKFWDGRFKKGLDKDVERFTSSLAFDKKLALYDIAGSIAHARSLQKINMLEQSEFEKIEKGLKEIQEKINKGSFSFHSEDEDIHTAIEKALIDMIGSVGGKLHTGRSRNDQVVTDLRMYCRDMVMEISSYVLNLQKILIEKSEQNKEVIMPGYTHMQRAQPILLSHYLLAYVSMLKRDISRLQNSFETINVLPLGSGALAGSGYNIDRQSLAKDLGFEDVSENSLDAVSCRDFVLELHSTLNILMIHLSRMSEELILWSTNEFNFIILDDAYTTGSSMMPQKKNPDVAELVRGKSGKILGNLTALTMVLKGLPLSYNRDLQEDKEGLFESVDTILQSLKCLMGLIETLEINKESMRAAIDDSYILATDLADYLVNKGLPFREAHKVVGQIVVSCMDKKLRFSQLSIENLKGFSSLFEEDVFQILEAEEAIKKRKVEGGTSPESVNDQIKKSKSWLAKADEWIAEKHKLISK